MTANELAEIADGLSCEIPIREWIDNEPKNVMNDIATMLRQQQAEIAELETGLKNVWKVVENKQAEIDRIVELYTDKAIENEALKDKLETAKKFAFNMNIRAVKAEKRELTDEEIESAYWSLVGKQHEGKIASYLYNFARDILKKAREK